MEMGSNLAADEEYINIELRSSSSSSSPQIKDFEFQHSSAKESAADDLFYKGKLLPLHLPPRRQMVEHLLCTSTTTAAAAFDHHFLSCSTAPCTNSNTPSDSCNISPSQSRRVSCDLNTNDNNTLFEINTFFKINHHHHHHHPTNNSWSKKLKIKHSFLTQKLKSSRAYLKSFFTKSKENSSSSRISRKFATLIKKHRMDDHRRSFSGAISTTNCSSSSTSTSSTSTSFNSSGLHELQFLRRRSSAAEIEVSIDAAIAHCKKTMQTFNGID